MRDKIDGLVQERHNSSALAMELRFSCTNPWKYTGTIISKNKLVKVVIL